MEIDTINSTLVSWLFTVTLAVFILFLLGIYGLLCVYVYKASVRSIKEAIPLHQQTKSVLLIGKIGSSIVAILFPVTVPIILLTGKVLNFKDE